jgi:hypothetical protein
MTPGELRERARVHDAKGEAALESGDAMGAALEFDRAELYRETARQMDELHRADPSLTVKQPADSLRTVTPQQQQAISTKLMGSDPNMKAARAAGYPSLRDLAKGLGVSVSFLSQVRAGNRPMPENRAAAFRKLTGKDWK